MELIGKRVFSEATPADDAPRGGRDSLFLMAELRVVGAPRALKVKVRNLSSGGLMAELPEPIPNDRPVEVDVRGIGWVRGRIAWQTEGRAGIAFEREIDPQRARKPVGTGAGNEGITPRPFVPKAGPLR